MKVQVGDRVYGIWNKWHDHSSDSNIAGNWMEAVPYSGKVIRFEEGLPVVKSKTLGEITIVTAEEDTINIKN
jgi:hypothetical protein